MAGRLCNGSSSAAEFEKAKLEYISAITKELQEAEELLIRLNQNFAYWAERTGEVEKLAMVWGTFQDQLSVFSGLVAWQSEQMDSVNESCFGLSTDDTETLQQHSEVPHRSNKELPH